MDLQIAIFINKLLAGTFLDSFTVLISDKFFLITLWILLLIIAFILDKKHRYHILIAIVISIIIHFLINELFFKEFLGYFTDLRVRPYLAYPDLIAALGNNSTDASFPSSHMSLTVAFITIFIYFFGKIRSATPASGVGWLIWLFGILLAIAMAFSRIHNGMHYPTDVIAGTILGIAYGIIGVYSAKKVEQKIGLFKP